LLLVELMASALFVVALSALLLVVLDVLVPEDMAHRATLMLAGHGIRAA